MNILFCLDTTFSRKNGGIASVSLTLTRGLESNGHKCFLLSAKMNCESECKKQYFLPKASFDDNIDTNRKWFRDFLKEKHIDIIINQNGTTPKSIWPLEWSKDLPIGKLTVYHSDLFSLWSCHKELLTANLFVKVLHLKPIVNYIWQSLFKIKYGSWLNIHYQLSDRIVFLTEKNFTSFEWFSGIKKDNRFVSIYNPIGQEINSSSFNPSKENEILFIGRLSKEKRLDYLLEIWEKVLPKHPDWRLTIVGDGNMRKYYEDTVHSKGLNNVFFEGFANPTLYYKRAKIFCLTSAMEGFPLVLAEAMSLECVPIAFNSFSSVSDIIDNGKCGYIIKPFDIEDYADKVSALIHNEDLRQEMSELAKKKSEQFTLDIILKKWEYLFSNL